jgi:predicted dithiol-disulfide oxidoreductase (DUF899 family)
MLVATLRSFDPTVGSLRSPVPKSRQLRRNNFHRVWRKACARAGFDGGPLDGLISHELRHTAVTLAVDQGAHPLAIKEIMSDSEAGLALGLSFVWRGETRQTRRQEAKEGRRSAMNTPPIVSPEEWKAARQKLLVEEKELTRARDALAARRRRMPWVAVEKSYRFEGPNGPTGLLDLFEGRRQLIVYRFFYGPEVTTYAEAGGAYPERACVGCSFVADQVAHPAHLNARDTTLAFVSRAPQAEIHGLKERMGWDVPWYTLTDDFDADFDVDEWHGTNAFIRDGDRIFRTYFIDSRGDEAMGGTWSYLDITALGRQEEWEDSPEGYPQTPPYEWWNYHDAYGDPLDRTQRRR